MSGVAEKVRGSFCSVLRQLFDRVGQEADKRPEHDLMHVVRCPGAVRLQHLRCQAWQDVTMSHEDLC